MSFNIYKIQKLEKKFPIISTFERKRLHSLKKKGALKPNNICNGDWSGPLTLNPQHKLICIFAVAGAIRGAIAQHFGVSETWISLILTSSIGRRFCMEAYENGTWSQLKGFALKNGLTHKDFKPSEWKKR